MRSNGTSSGAAAPARGTGSAPAAPRRGRGGLRSGRGLPSAAPPARSEPTSAGRVRDSFEERDPTARVRVADRPEWLVFGRVVPVERACERGELEDHRARSRPLALADVGLATTPEITAAVTRGR